MRRLLWAFPIAVFLLNPNLACGPGDPDFHYGAAEMRAAVEGDWSFMITPSGGAPVPVTVHLEQASALVSIRGQTGTAIRSAQACGTRTLIRGADACIDATQMPLAVTYVAGDSSFAAPETKLSGNFTAVGLTFGGGILDVSLGPYQNIEVQVNADGSVRSSILASATVVVSRS